MDRGTTAAATTDACVRHWLADHRRRVSRRARDRPSPVRQTARDRARVSRRELLRWKTYGGGGPRRRNPTTRSAPDVACRLLAGRADDRAIGAGRAIRDRIGVPRALGLAAGLGLEAWQSRRVRRWPGFPYRVCASLWRCSFSPVVFGQRCERASGATI